MIKKTREPVPERERKETSWTTIQCVLANDLKRRTKKKKKITVYNARVQGNLCKSKIGAIDLAVRAKNFQPGPVKI